MGISIRSAMAAMLLVTAFSTQVCLPAEAQYYRGYVRQNPVKSFFNRHPKVKAATVGGAVGTAAGAGVGLISGRGVGRGALIGAGTGAGVGLIRSSQMLRRHPIIKDTATGGVVGLGIGAAAGRGRRPAVKGAAVGAGVGLGIGALRQVLR
jgi:hypothetical protein